MKKQSKHQQTGMLQIILLFQDVWNLKGQRSIIGGQIEKKKNLWVKVSYGLPNK